MAERYRLVSHYRGGVVHVRQDPLDTVCGFVTTPADVWRDEGWYDGKEFETMCQRCRNILRQRAAHREGAKT